MSSIWVLTTLIAGLLVLRTKRAIGMAGLFDSEHTSGPHQLKTAKALNLTIPHYVLAQANGGDAWHRPRNWVAFIWVVQGFR